jgi:cell wall assembly regulator SMI1
MDVVAAWGVIEEWLAADAPSIRKSLRPPGDDARVENLQKKLKLPLPPDFIASVRVHDGQKSDAEHGLFPAPPDELGSVPSYRLLPLTDSGREWAMMRGLHDTGEFEGRKPKPARGLQHVWWSPAWVPIADNGGGDYFCLDLAPGQGGAVGQVILFGHEGTDRRRVAKSLAEWLGKLARGFAAGQYVLDEDDGLREA